MATRIQKSWGSLQAALALMDQVAVVEGLQAEVAEELVPLGAEGPGEPVQVEAEEVRADPPDPDPVLDGVLEERRVPGPHLIEGQGLPLISRPNASW